MPDRPAERRRLYWRRRQGHNPLNDPLDQLPLSVPITGRHGAKPAGRSHPRQGIPGVRSLHLSRPATQGRGTARAWSHDATTRARSCSATGRRTELGSRPTADRSSPRPGRASVRFSPLLDGSLLLRSLPRSAVKAARSILAVIPHARLGTDPSSTAMRSRQSRVLSHGDQQAAEAVYYAHPNRAKVGARRWIWGTQGQ